jgi:hypothetical protein
MHGPHTEYEFHYSRYPELAKYINRIGAEQLNFKRFMVKEYHGSHYYVEKVLIKINADFSIDCRDPEYMPTEAEAEAIQTELSSVVFPKSCKATPGEADLHLKSGLITGTPFLFYDNARKEVIMIQERRDLENGGKVYIPWTMFSAPGRDSFWRQLEPDGPLPFWKPYKMSQEHYGYRLTHYQRIKASIMVHEGAKVAAYIDALLNDPARRQERDRHPWAEELSHFEHWGAIGGALAMHRCDYDELRREQIDGDLVYVCDHDPPGEEAVRTFSRMWGQALIQVKFNNQFEPGFDLADELPQRVLNGNGTARHRLMDLALPATWATTELSKKSKSARC